MFALYKLQAKAWISNIFNKMDFFLTILFLGVLGSFVVMQAGNNGASYGSSNELILSSMNVAVISSISLLMIASSAINTFGMSFFEMKQSVLLKRIGATEISKLQAVVSFILWGMTSMFFILGWMMFWIGICQIPGVASITNGLLWVDKSVWNNINWIGIISAVLITMISFYAIAFFFVSISKNSTSYQMTATFYFFFISFLGGAYTPNADRLWMDVISFMSPLGWGTDLMTAAFHGGNVFNIVDGFEYYPIIGGDPIVVDNLKAIGEIGLPILYGGLAAGFSAKFFKWD